MYLLLPILIIAALITIIFQLESIKRLLKQTREP
jgi:hypothetical protein